MCRGASYDGAVATPRSPERSVVWVLAPLLVFAWITLAVATAAKTGLLEQDSSKPTYFDLFFSDTIHLKAWLASVVIVLALFQVVSAAWIYGRIPWRRPSWIGFSHRWSGRAAFVVSLPVAYHCIFLLGFEDTSGRVLAHSFAGIFFYGALGAKIVVVRSRYFPGWLLPVMGGLVFSLLVTLWLTSSLWFFRTIDSGF